MDSNTSEEEIFEESFFSPFGAINMRTGKSGRNMKSGSDGSFSPNEVDYMSDEAGVYVIVVFVMYAIVMALLIYRYMRNVSPRNENGTELKMYSNLDGTHELILKSTQMVDERSDLLNKNCSNNSCKISNLGEPEEEEEEFDYDYRPDDATETLV